MGVPVRGTTRAVVVVVGGSGVGTGEDVVAWHEIGVSWVEGSLFCLKVGLYG